MLTHGAYLSKVRTARAAVIPYIVKKNGSHKQIYFLLAKDKESGDITDFGGGVKKNEFSLLAGLREFKEESDEIFGDIYNKVNSMGKYVALLGLNMSVLFLPLKEKWLDLAPKLFLNKRNSSDKDQKKSYNEISELLWVDDNDFKRLLLPQNNKMWSRIRKFYKKAYTYRLSKALKLVYCY